MSVLLNSYRFATGVFTNVATGLSSGTGVANNPTIPAIPLRYSGLKIWLEAGTGKITHSSDAISQWADSSPVGTNSANQATSGNKPTRQTYSGRDVAYYDGSDSLIVTTNAGLQTAVGTLVVAADFVSLAQYGSVAMKRSGSTGFEIYTSQIVGSGDTTADLKFVTDNTIDCSIKSGGGQFGKHTFSVRCGATNVVTKWDGAGGTTTAATFTPGGYDFYVGASSGAPSSGQFNGTIYEWLWYDNDLGASATAEVEAYLKARHSTT